MSFFGNAAALFRHRVIAATAGAATAVLVAGCAFAAAAATGSGPERLSAVSDSRSTGSSASSSASSSSAAARPTASAPVIGPLRVISVTPARGAAKVNGGAPITVTFSSRLAPSTPLPTLSPAIGGHWAIAGATATFTPASGYLPGTHVTVTVPGGADGMLGADGPAGTLAQAQTVSFTTGTYSVLRLEQILAHLGYLPLNWRASPGSGSGSVAAADANAQVSAAYDPPAGNFTFKPGYPSELTSQWQAGSANILLTGAVRAFQFVQGIPMDGVVGPQVWASLLTAAARGQANPNGYTYALADQAPPITLRVWHNGRLILNTPANTGAYGAGTADGTYPVYLRYQFQIMKGTNPDGSKYADPVSWISYFNGGDAVHAFPRYSYGSYQSDGCVELPTDTGKYIWPYLTYGSLVTVEGPEA